MHPLTLALVALAGGIWLAWLSRPDCRPELKELVNSVAWYAPHKASTQNRPDLLKP